MHLISNKKLKDFAAKHPPADEPLQAWRKIMESRTFVTFADMKATFNTVDRVGSYCVFNVGGNKYRVIAAVHFDRQKMYIREVFTHKEYNTWKP
jgi:mRNA interferase HigB